MRVAQLVVQERLTVEVVTDGGAAGSDVTPLHLTSDPSTEQLLGEDPVEHVVAGSDRSYEDRRRFIIDKYYDVVD